MKLSQILAGADIVELDADCDVTGLAYDSRKVKPGDAFVAIKGGTADGGEFISQAIGKGAIAVIAESGLDKWKARAATAKVKNDRRALAIASANFAGNPARELALVGITGTNGKSTTAFLVESILKAGGRDTCLVGTIEYHIGGKVLSAPHTTPESLELNLLLAAARKQGASEAVMEVSSHALEQQRVMGLHFDVAAFTNLTQDHLDYHGDMESYFRAKCKLFEGCGAEAPKVSVVNAEDSFGARLIASRKQAGSEVVTYGVNEGDLQAREVSISQTETSFRAITPNGEVALRSALIGRVNVMNILCAVAVGQARGCTNEEIAEGIAKLEAVPGRFEAVICGQPFRVVVDYAHTDDALRNLTKLARELTSGRVITVFGCGGDRDREKRPAMARAAAEKSDLVILTSDNPRSEEPNAIINDAVEGLDQAGANYMVEPDRAQAIAQAVREAKAGDIVLIAGKGHERVQIGKGGAVPFDDRVVAAEALASCGYARVGDS